LIKRYFDVGNSRAFLYVKNPMRRKEAIGRITHRRRPLMLSASQFSARPTAITRRKKLARKKKKMSAPSRVNEKLPIVTLAGASAMNN